MKINTDLNLDTISTDRDQVFSAGNDIKENDIFSENKEMQQILD